MPRDVMDSVMVNLEDNVVSDPMEEVQASKQHHSMMTRGRRRRHLIGSRRGKS